MDECWLKPNRRAVWPLAALPALLAAVGAAVFAWGVIVEWPLWRVGLAGVVAGLGLTATFTVARWAKRPRLAYRDNELLVFLNATEPLRVPIDVVEVFFRGQSEVPMAGLQRTAAKTSNVIVRLAEAAPQWHHRDIPATFGKWAEGYIILSGTWCEPITLELLRELNGRLAAVHRARRGCGGEQAAVCGASSGPSQPCGNQNAPAFPATDAANHSPSGICPGSGEPCGSHATCPGTGGAHSPAAHDLRTPASMTGGPAP